MIPEPPPLDQIPTLPTWMFIHQFEGRAYPPGEEPRRGLAALRDRIFGRRGTGSPKRSAGRRARR